MQPEIRKISLSVDEIALCFSLVNQAEVGKSILQNTYGTISATSIEDKLTSASHSLLARGLVQISQQGSVLLDESLELMLFPCIKFVNIIQFVINNTVESDPEISNIYIGRNKVFTALRINRGVVYELTQANIKDLPELLNRWLDLPLHAAILTSPEPRSIFIKMADIAQLMSEQGDNRERVLKSAGFPDRLAKNLLGDLKSPGKRGSVVVTDLNSDNYVSRNTEETGAGFLFLGGKDVNWIFNYDKADEQTEAQVVIAKESTATEIISELIRDFL